MELLGYFIHSSPNLGGFHSYIGQISSKKGNDSILSCDICRRCRSALCSFSVKTLIIGLYCVSIYSLLTQFPLLQSSLIKRNLKKMRPETMKTEDRLKNIQVTLKVTTPSRHYLCNSLMVSEGHKTMWSERLLQKKLFEATAHLTLDFSS